MEKLKLNLDDLKIEFFETTSQNPDGPKGTVHGNIFTATCQCTTYIECGQSEVFTCQELCTGGCYTEGSACGPTMLGSCWDQPTCECPTHPGAC